MNVIFPDNVIEFLRGLSPIITYDIFFTVDWWPQEEVKYDPNIDAAFYQM